MPAAPVRNRRKPLPGQQLIHCIARERASPFLVCQHYPLVI